MVSAQESLAGESTLQQRLEDQDWRTGELLVVSRLFEVISDRGFKPFLVGGALRDLLISENHTFRDIDLLVDGASATDLQHLFKDRKVERNSFGGLRLRASSSSLRRRVSVDVWALEDSWALQKENALHGIEEFLKTPFLNVDSIAATKNAEGRWRIYERGFGSALKHKIIEINYEPNPNPLLCAMRALIVARKFQYALSQRTAKYVLDKLTSSSPQDWMAVQRKHYGKPALRVRLISSLIPSIWGQLTVNSPSISVHDPA